MAQKLEEEEEKAVDWVAVEAAVAGSAAAGKTAPPWASKTRSPPTPG
jgi:hypothetical protein